jgi:hypothetical protein
MNKENFREVRGKGKELIDLANLTFGTQLKETFSLNKTAK